MRNLSNNLRIPAAVLLTLCTLGLTGCMDGDMPADLSVVGLDPDDGLADFTLGTELNTRGVVNESDRARRFMEGQVVYYSMRVVDAEPDTEVSVEWAANSAPQRRVESTTVGTNQSLSFDVDTTGWPAGHYEASIRVDGDVVDEKIFEVIVA